MSSKHSHLIWACVLVCVWGTIANAQTVNVCFRDAFGLTIVQRDLPAGQDALTTAVTELIAGPVKAERDAGIFTSIPKGTVLEGVSVADDMIVVELSRHVVAGGMDDMLLQAIHEQFISTLGQFPENRSVRLTSEGVTLSDYLKPEIPIEPAPSQSPVKITKSAAMMAMAGTALTGRKVAISPGHGLYWNGSGWYNERPITCAPLDREDYHNVELMYYVNLYLQQDGATTKVYRCLDKNYGNYVTGEPWWHMSAAYWIKQLGYPCSVYASSTGDCTLGSGSSESSDSLRSRPLASNYDNTDIYISMHTNALSGDCYGFYDCPNGTCTYYDASSTHAQWAAVSQALAQNINSNIVDVIRTKYTDSTWRDRGALNSDGGFAETRMPTRAAVLIELAFHDSCDRDGLYLNDNFFRSATTWGVYKGVCDYFGVTPTYGFYSNEYVSDTIPLVMQPGQSYNVSITLRNRGVLWTEAKQIRLGAVGNSDPFSANTRIYISGEVDPAQTHMFYFTMTAPTTPGIYISDWQMVREGVTWFGATVSKTITVGSVSHYPPTVTLQPAGMATSEGGAASFAIQATGDAPLTYQWQKDGVNLVNDSRVTGANTPTLQIANVVLGDQGSYRCLVSNPYGSSYSDPAVLTVIANVFMVESCAGGQNVEKYSESGTWADSGSKSTASGVTGGIGSRYGSTYRSVAGEKHAYFKANLPAAGLYEVFATWPSGTNRRTPILHRISHADGLTDVNVDQAVTANVWVSLGVYRFPAGTDAGQVDVNNLNIDVSGSMYADAIKWVFINPPVITTHPTSQTICPGNSTQFTVAATGQGTLTYQWKKDGANLANGGHYSGVTTATLTISSSDGNDAGNYRCVVSNSSGSANSNEASLTLGGGAIITQQPASINACPNGTAQFTVVATGEGTLSYQWQKNNVNLSNGGHYSGVTTSTLTVSSVSRPDVASYRCVVTGGCGSTYSSSASLGQKNVTNVTSQPASQLIYPGGMVQFHVSAVGSGTMTYQWQKDGVNISNGGHYSGVTTSTLFITNASSEDLGSYRCVVTGDCGSSTSNTAALTLTASRADFNNDAHVDATDFDFYSMCYNGPTNLIDETCQQADFNNDQYVDAVDFDFFSACYNGPTNPPRCSS